MKNIFLILTILSSGIVICQEESTLMFTKLIDLNSLSPVAVQPSLISDVYLDNKNSYHFTQDYTSKEDKSTREWNEGLIYPQDFGEISQCHINFIEEYYSSGSGFGFARALYCSIDCGQNFYDVPVTYDFYIGDFTGFPSIEMVDDNCYVSNDGNLFQDRSDENELMNGMEVEIQEIKIEFFDNYKVCITIVPKSE